MCDREKFRIVIEFCIKLGDNLPEVVCKLRKAYGTECPHRSTITRWFYYFKRGGKGTQDALRRGRPPNPVNPRLLDQISNELERNPKISLHILGSIVGETKGYVSNVIYTRLKHRRVNARWVPQILTEAQKKASVQNTKMILNDYKNNWNSLVDHLITVDETWVYYELNLTPKTAGEWQLPGKAPPQVSRIKSNPKKIMATVFWNS